MINTPLIQDLIFKGDVHGIKSIMKKSRELGMQTFDMSLFDLYEAGQIAYEDALRNADSMNELRLAIKLEGHEARERDRFAEANGLSILGDGEDVPMDTNVFGEPNTELRKSNGVEAPPRPFGAKSEAGGGTLAMREAARQAAAHQPAISKNRGL